MIHQGIRKLVKLLQINHGLTQMDITTMLGYRSQTSLVRLMKNQANAETLNKMAVKLRTCEQLMLTDEENRMIDDILECAELLEDDDYQALLKLRELLRGTEEEHDPIMLTVVNGETELLTERYRCVQCMHMLVINCERLPLLQEIASMMPMEGFQVDHYMYMDQQPLHTVQAIRALLPLLYTGHYEGYSIVTDDTVWKNPLGLLHADLLVCDYVTEAGESRHDFIVFRSVDNGVVVETDRTVREFLSILPSKELFCPIHYVSTTPMTANYLEYCQFCQMLENGRAVYRIKQDVGIEQLPIPILKRAIIEGPMIDEFDRDHLLAEYEAIFQKRQDQMMDNAAPQRHVMKKQAMWQFVRTGLLSDHFWACRSFTIEERAAVIESLLWQINCRPDFKIFFLKYDADLRDEEFILYDGIGLTIIKPGTDYHLGQGHEETLISQAEFMNVFCRFYNESILRYHVLPEEKSKEILMEMLSWCRTQACADPV